MFLSAVCDRTAKVQNFPDVTIEKSQNFPTLIYFSICTYSTCHMEGTSHIQLWLVVSQETYGDSLRLFFRRN